MKNNSVYALVIFSLGAASGLAHADNAENPITLINGVTLYGTIDIGYSYQSHGSPANDYYSNGVTYFPLRAANSAQSQLSGNGLSQSNIGVRGEKELRDGWSGLFKVETVISPIGGQIVNGQKSLIQNNGRPISTQTASNDSSLDGQLFNSAAYAGIKSSTYGEITVGRNFGVLKDAVVKYDPLAGSYAFSAVGGSNTASGGGSGEYTRINQSIRYANAIGPLRVDALYAGKTASQGGAAFQFGLGAEYRRLALDVVYAEKKQSVSASALGYASGSSATSISRLNGAINSSLIRQGYAYDQGIGADNALVGTVADTTAWAAMAKYDFGGAQLFGGYERISYTNPSTPYAAGSNSLGGYQFAIVNNNAYTSAKLLQVVWGGLKYAVTPKLDVTAAVYRYLQNSYSGNACATPAATAPGTTIPVNRNNPCGSGEQNSYSLVVDYKYNSYFDFYAGMMVSGLSGGMASGFAHTSLYNAMTGVRLHF